MFSIIITITHCCETSPEGEDCTYSNNYNFQLTFHADTVATRLYIASVPCSNKKINCHAHYSYIGPCKHAQKSYKRHLYTISIQLG